MSNDQKNYLEQARTLSEEIETSLLAIASDRLDAFEDSLWKQQVLCVSLAGALESLRATQGNTAVSGVVRDSTASLRSASCTYAALIEQTQRSTRLLYKLCQDYQLALCRDTMPDTPHVCSMEA